MSIVSDLEKVLADEQRCLVRGDYEGLEALIGRKTMLIDQISEKKPDLPPEIYQRLAQRAAHNDALLGAARRGLQSALRQLKEVSEGEIQSTYSREGERTSMSRKRSTMIQKI